MSLRKHAVATINRDCVQPGPKCDADETQSDLLANEPRFCRLAFDLLVVV